ncbi:MAG: 7-cyano-7-deazaguanine synthase QueC [Planctomycetota bacterium]
MPSKGQNPPAVVLLSGGLDSATVLAIAQDEGFDVHALSFAYGQRHRFELDAARTLAKRANVADHRIANIDLTLFGGSALTDDALAVPKDRPEDELSHGVPVTYVPARNTIFLSFALAFAETIGSTDIFLGVNALDYSGYPDCRPEYLDAFTAMANLATAIATEDGKRINIHAPLIDLTKARIIQRGHALGVDYAITHTCYDPAADGRACGRCDACVLRRRGFKLAGLPDPTLYAND